MTVKAELPIHSATYKYNSIGHQLWQPEFKCQDPHGGSRETSCPSGPHICAWHWSAPPSKSLSNTSTFSPFTFLHLVYHYPSASPIFHITSTIVFPPQLVISHLLPILSLSNNFRQSLKARTLKKMGGIHDTLRFKLSSGILPTNLLLGM